MATQKIAFFLCFLIHFLCNALSPTITIRPAQETDLPGLYELDRIVSFEYFKPLYLKGYAHCDLGKNPDHYLKLELEDDKVWFPQCIRGETDSRFLIALDTSNNTVAGLIIIQEKSPTIAQIDLLLILKEYRGWGIGKALVRQALQLVPTTQSCMVYPFRLENRDTLAFYEKLGFENRGRPTFDTIGIYGLPYSELYLYYHLDLPTNPIPRTSILLESSR